MKIIKAVLVKRVLTEKSKETMLTSFESERNKLNLACKQLEFEKRKVLKRQPNQYDVVINRFEEELNSRRKRIEQLEFEIEQLQILPLGTELQAKKIQAIEEVEIGDDWERLTAPSEIIIKDGIVVEIR
ncbi:YlqD family protein [Bacillus taeanensis]|uniref:YlqD family protein n=1 Tax=Bacillus taeanensis TaxID=273032 RepID=UPI0015F1042C|nr:YlqD family protein [Bacillus taeanensis]